MASCGTRDQASGGRAAEKRTVDQPPRAESEEALALVGDAVAGGVGEVVLAVTHLNQRRQQRADESKGLLSRRKPSRRGEERSEQKTRALAVRCDRSERSAVASSSAVLVACGKN